ncbi:MAG: VOC family protein [Promethearchaeati archaeon]
MSDQEILNLKDLKIFQLGYVYRDIDKQAKIMEEVWGMPKFAKLGPNTNEIIYRGEKSTYTTRIAMSRYFGKQIELIEWVSGEGIHKEFLDNGNEGFQHISCMVEGLDDYIELFKKNKMDPVFIGNIGKQHFAYFDTENTLGFLIELQETKKRRREKKL